ncbi:MAG: hypothetical protein IJA31_10670 [Clostridia bacterium]|nr:hypothetical protein [Clostridia bacterium]
MKKRICNILSVLLVVLMLVPMAAPAAAASGAAVPTVYCQGQGATLVNAQGEAIYPLNIEIMPIVEECMPLFIDALTTGAYDAWYDKLREEVIPLFEEIQLDNNGEIADGSYVAWTWNYNSLKGPSASYGIRDYVMEFDWRLDPFANAEVLERYIADVMRKTGSDKVNLVGRCEGANIVMAYLAEYGYDNVNCVAFYVQSLYGVDAVSAAFSGNIRLNTASLEAWMNSNLDLEDDSLSELLYSFLALAQNTYTLPVLAEVINLFVDKLYSEIMPEMLLNTYGGFPGIWALVNSEDYEDAKKVMFGGKEEEYAGMIEKLDNYDTKVRQRVDEIILDGIQAGVKFASFAKYGYISIPLDETAKELSDSLVILNRASFGATCANRGAILSEDYIEARKENGNDIYLSPDNNIDASTCLFPDTTWIIKDSSHKNFPDSEHVLMEKFIHSDGTMTVFTDDNYPQYMIYDAESGVLTPYEGSPVEDVVEKPMTIKEYCIRFVNAILAFIYKLFNNWLKSE